MNKWAELLVGLVLVILPIVIGWYSQTWGISWLEFWSAAGIFFRGGFVLACRYDWSLVHSPWNFRLERLIK